MSDAKKFEFGMDALCMTRVDAGAAVKRAEPDHGSSIICQLS